MKNMRARICLSSNFIKGMMGLLALAVFAVSGCATAPSVAPPRPAKIAVVLGAGASKGFAHIGVLKVLEAHQIPIHMVVGTSAGSLVGSLYASGKNAFELQAIAMKMEADKVVDYDWRVWKGGLIKGEKIEKFINENVRYAPIEKLKIPFFAVATNAATGEEVAFGRGNTGMAVRASCAVPGVFHPVKIGNTTYVDGAVVSPVAVDVARRNGADIVIAVDISGGLSADIPEGMVDALLRAKDIMYARIAEYQIKNADVVIRPNMKGIGSTEIEKFNEAIFEGEKAATAKIPEILQIVERLKKEGRL